MADGASGSLKRAGVDYSWMEEIERQATTPLSSSSGAVAADTAGDVRHQALVNDLLQSWDRPGPAGELLSDEGAKRVRVAHLAKSSPLCRSFKKQLNILVKLLQDESSPNLRKCWAVGLAVV